MEDNLKNNKPYPLYRRIVKIFLWTLMAVVLLFYGVVTSLVCVLSPDKLTPLTCKAVERMTDADISIVRVEFSAMSTYPFLKLEIDSLTIVSPLFSELKADTVNRLPQYADTVIAFDRFVGEMRLPDIVKGRLYVNNVTVSGLQANAVILNDSTTNYDIFPASADDEPSSGPVVLPKIVLNHFALDNSKPFRYFDSSTGINADMRLTAVLDKNHEMPHYRFQLGGNFNSPLFEDYKLQQLSFGFDGAIVWSSESPYVVEIEDCSLDIAQFGVNLDLGVDFASNLIVNKFDAELKPVDVCDLMSFVPDSLSKLYRLDALKTDAAVSLYARLDSAFAIVTDTLPYATVRLEIPECKAVYGKARLDKLAASIQLTLSGNDLNAAVVDISKLQVAGPATNLDISGRLSEIMTDPLVDARITGFTDLTRLPPPLQKLIEGYISGRLTAKLSFKGRPSMFDRNRFHQLKVAGDIDGKDLYWVSPDTSNMVFINDLCLQFGTNKRFEGSRDLLAVTLKADSTNLLSGGTSLLAKNFAIGLAAENLAPTADTTIVIPMGGGLSVGLLNVQSVADSAGVRIRDIAGRVVMHRYENMKRVPEFIFNLGIKRMAASMPDVRVLLSDSKLDFSAHKLPERKPSKRVKALADSISHARPDLPMDSVYAIAIAHSRRSHGHHRGHAQMIDSTTEIIDWGTSKALGKLLLGWKLDGELYSSRVGLFTPHFPLRNRLVNLDIRFDNDSLVFRNLAYKVGRSDFLAAGKITNIKRSLTARRRVSPLKLEFETYSDTIDVNQIADGFFRGASYSKSYSGNLDLDVVDDADGFDAALEPTRDAVADTLAPVLIPANIQADINVKAKNVIYSDLLMHNMTGGVLVYDGAVNLQQLKAASDVGSVDLSALYSAPDAADIHFGFGLKVKRFDISRFMTMMPALDSIMPLLRNVSGIIDANIAATSAITPSMDFDLPSLTAVIKLQGDSLQLLDGETFRTIAKWLMFKNKKRNIIDHMDVDLVVNDNQMYLYPFIFDIDRYRLGVQGHNDLALNFNYLISVLKSPLPFKFGITLKGNPDDYKIRLGKAKFNEKQAVERSLSVDTTRINLIEQIENMFRRGVRQSEFAKLKVPANPNVAADISLDDNPVSAADSLLFIKEGLIPAPAPVDSVPTNEKNKDKK